MLRSPAERIRQTLCFEIVGLAFVTPLFLAITGAKVSEGTILMVAISVAVMFWSPIHNAAFDIFDLHFYRRVASSRPPFARVIHAISHEVTAAVVSLPILMWLGGLPLRDAMVANVLLTLFYTAYAFVFHLVFDRLRPVQIPQVAERLEDAA